MIALDEPGRWHERDRKVMLRELIEKNSPRQAHDFVDRTRCETGDGCDRGDGARLWQANRWHSGASTAKSKVIEAYLGTSGH
ncbi:MAG: hypothetical protein IPH54_06615 [Rhodoferax sp.]|nr:hypothetical protein [Rhodoferax sp.]